MRSHTVSAEGGAAGGHRAPTTASTSTPTTPSPAATGWATRTPSRRSSRRRPQELLQLEHWGCPWSREPDGRVAVRAVRRHEEDAHLVRRRQDRLPHAAHAVPDLAEVRPRSSATTSGSSPSCWSTTAGCRAWSRIEMRTGRIEAITAKAVILVHRRLRPGLPVHHQREHQDRRRHGARLPRRRAAEGHGVRPVPPDRPAVHRHPDHRGGPRRGRLPGQQGRLPLPAGLRPRQAGADAGAAQHGARPARPAVAGVRQGGGEGPDHRRRRTATSSTSTCATWARRRSTRSCRSCASCA